VPEEKTLSVGLLGLPEVRFEGRPLRFGRRKALALLCYLAAEGGHHPRGELAELLWPKSEKRRARTDLRSILASLRKTLGEDLASDRDSVVARVLAFDGELLGLAPQEVELDLRVLESAVLLARSETSETMPRGEIVHDSVGSHHPIARLEETLGLYRGEFMEGFSLDDTPEFDLWLEAERERWRGVFGELCERVSRLQAETGRLESATATARLWARHAPLEEAAYLRLAELLSAAGEGEQAFLASQEFRNTLKSELEIEPSVRMRELAERLRKEVEERTPLSESLAHSATTASLSPLEIPFMGRHEEFGVLVSEYHASGKGPRVVAVIGEAGIGKTRLVEEFLGWARVRGADILVGGSLEGAGLPYGPLVEAIRPRIERERAPDDLLDDAWLSELSRLLPELKDRYPDLPAPSSGEGETAKGILFEAIARTVGVLASRAPVVLFLDDMHWADGATRDFLRYAGGRWVEEGTPVLVLIASRPEEPTDDSPFEGWLSSLGRRLPIRRLSLSTLGNEDVKRLLRRLVDVSTGPEGDPREPGDPAVERAGLELLGEWLVAESGGQPFYLVETLKALLEEGKLVVRASSYGTSALEVSPTLRIGDVSGVHLPQSVREVILSRVYRLFNAARDLLTAAAVMGRGFSFETLLGVARLEEAEGLAALDELIGRRLLLEVGDGREVEGSALRQDAAYAFSHEKIRQVVYTEAGQARRRVLHRRAFEMLEEVGAPAAERAGHALAAGLAEPSFAYSVAAGDEAAEVFAVRDAIVHYERAREVLDAEQRLGRGLQPSTPDLEHLYTQLGRAYEMAVEWGKATAVYDELLAIGRESKEPGLEVIALNHLAILEFHQQETNPARVRRLLEEARRVAEEAGLEEALVETESNLADFVSFWVEGPEQARLSAEKALGSARALVERPDLVARALWTLARVEMFSGRLQESAAYAEEGAALSRDLTERPASRTHVPSMMLGIMGLGASWRVGFKGIRIRCLNFLAFDMMLQGRLQEGMGIACEALTESRELRDRAEAMGSWALGLGLVETGEYEEGLELCRRGTELARKTKNTLLLWYNLNHLGRAHEALLDLEKARRNYEEEIQLRGPLGPRFQVFSSIRLCAVAALAEDWQEAHAHALRVHESRTSSDVLDGLYHYHVTEALLRGGDMRLALEEVDRFTDRAMANERNRISYLRSLAVLSEWGGNTQRAKDQLHQARTLAEKIGLPGELWQIQSRIGTICERRGETEEARAAFSLALQTIRMLADKIADEELKEGFLTASRVRRVLGRNKKSHQH
jgi:DNA-binding SARP family transcriptional activator/tetratricopeptide (TPR) repeat protein